MKKIYLVLAILLITNTFLQAQSNALSQNVDAALQDLTKGVTNNGGGYIGSMVSFSHKEDTKGNRYLFTEWAKGSVVGSNDVVINNDSLLFNYDKITHDLYLTTDKVSAIDVDKSKVKSFSLKGNDGNVYSFEKIPLINPDIFFQPLVENVNKYSAYKLTKTKFVKSDYHSDGMVETGKNYDEYVDEDEYYIVLPGGKEFKKVDLKKKSIKQALQQDASKTDSYFAQHKQDDINEAFLKDLITSLNS